MKRNYNFRFKYLLLGLILLTVSVKAQKYVTIPDSSFVYFLQANYATCMNGNKLDTTCSNIKSVQSLYVSSKKIKDLSGVQYFSDLKNLTCTDNLLKTLPSLSNTKLHTLNCNNNLLVALPPLPKTLCSLECRNNKLTFLPALNPCTEGLMCSNNQITALPEIPAHIQMLTFSNNKITCIPILPDSSIYMFEYENNPFTCVSNYISAMDTTFKKKYPICKEDDKTNNPYDCYTPRGIRGYIFKDENNDCKQTNGDAFIKSVALQLYDTTGQLITKTYSDKDGEYEFLTYSRKYTVKVDTANVPFTVKCPYPGIDSTVKVNKWEYVDFSISCKPGFDLSIQSVLPQGWVFPGRTHTLSVMAGNTDNWYALKCIQGVSGQVKITVLGPVKFVNPAPGALIPQISGNTYTYSIADFGNVNNQIDFSMLFKTDTTAQATDRVCVLAEIIPSSSGDLNTANNSYKFCYNVVNSLDPNMKEVYPLDVLPEYKDWFTYTIHFQNTGNAPAMDIKLTDTLDKNLDLETFQVLNYSHFNKATLKGNALQFKFPDIQLADSTSNPEGSKGFIQYRIKPKTNLSAGTVISNKAFIYFDYNPPVITNTTLNHYTTTVSLPENEGMKQIVIYPNPSNGYFYIELNDKMLHKAIPIEIYNMLGKVVWNGITASKTVLVDLNHFANGVYLVKIQGDGISFNQRIIKQ